MAKATNVSNGEVPASSWSRMTGGGEQLVGVPRRLGLKNASH